MLLCDLLFARRDSDLLSTAHELALNELSTLAAGDDAKNDAARIEIWQKVTTINCPALESIMVF
jgi:hypothetical protein